MSALIRRNINYQFGATLAGFIATISLAAIVGWATVGTSPTIIIAQAEHSKA